MGNKALFAVHGTGAGRAQAVCGVVQTLEAGVDVAGKLPGDGAMRWELVDSDSSRVVAEHPLKRAPAATLFILSTCHAGIHPAFRA